MDLKSLRKMESLPPSMQVHSRSDDETVVVIVKLRENVQFPSYVTPRAKISDRMFSAQMRAGDLVRLEKDPAVESMSLSRSLPVIE
ncbi:hypothetical protein CO661_27020 [Sinorhizobium fredii]|uniref:Uncharacterized protein n=1 Tax=Rhizobium fredii TaxID=380 RepID=A0A2A6LQ64_RHIFR|nr:hypothetical protein [Sinorhizobium fredii]PDT44744.1 hypothetical protein CO661_27020 [Sinorhizobium fredii]